ncbi:DUF4209 domain-containing protein [Bacillus sp. AFS029533]|uniref:DUF4209 domain-containing protein n=1 Tax=Bacillus sp. AFS029533 TaxID=2033494 RepID=UPI000BFE7346|nr:DUF4209 domain-containing protein [Bacillus sp. AFS029533]PGZ92186.1 hypothetical protein COE53_12545 [Bacillus sp. AFS029533]
MNFLNFEKQLEQYLVNEGVFSYFGSKFNDLGYKYIDFELIIQNDLIDFREQSIDKDIIDYASKSLEECSFIKTKVRYYIFLIKNSKKKYIHAKGYVDWFLANIREIIKDAVDKYFINQSINTLLEVSGSMDIRKDDVWTSILNYLKLYPNCIFSHAIRLTAFINNKERENEFVELLNEQLIESANIGNYLPIEQLLEDSSKSKRFPVERLVIQRRLAESYMKQVKDDNSDIRVIHFAQKAASMYKLLKDSEEENKCLSMISKCLESDSSDWNETEFVLSTEINDAINENIRLINELFSNSEIKIQDRITYLSKFITIKEEETNMNVILYKPVPILKDIDRTAAEFNKSVFMQFASVVTLDQNKVISNGNDALLKAKELAYSMHKVTTILPALAALENSKDFSIEELIICFQKCPLVTEDELKFISEALVDYASGRWISFICVIVPSFESILRQLYFEIEGTDIQAKNTDTLVHTTVNLTTILKNNKVKEVLTEDFVTYLEYLLNSDTSSENIRNNVAHRITKCDFYSKERSQVLIHALVQMCERIKNKILNGCDAQ